MLSSLFSIFVTKCLSWDSSEQSEYKDFMCDNEKEFIGLACFTPCEDPSKNFRPSCDDLINVPDIFSCHSKKHGRYRLYDSVLTPDFKFNLDTVRCQPVDPQESFALAYLTDIHKKLRKEHWDANVLSYILRILYDWTYTPCNKGFFEKENSHMKYFDFEAFLKCILKISKKDPSAVNFLLKLLQRLRYLLKCKYHGKIHCKQVKICKDLSKLLLICNSAKVDCSKVNCDQKHTKKSSKKKYVLLSDYAAYVLAKVIKSIESFIERCFGPCVLSNLNIYQIVNLELKDRRRTIRNNTMIFVRPCKNDFNIKPNPGPSRDIRPTNDDLLARYLNDNSLDLLSEENAPES